MKASSRWVPRSTERILTVIMIAGFVLLALTSPETILTTTGLQGFLTYLSVPILIGLGQMAAICVGQLNLSIGALGGLCCALMAILMADSGWPVPVALLAGVVVTAALGALNGLLIVATGLHGFIVTLATMTILIGGQFAVIGSRTVSEYSPALRTFGREGVLGVPYVFVATVMIAAAVSVYFARTYSGRKVLATGGSPVAARLSGISNNRSLVIAFMISGLLTGCAAVVTMTSLPGINTSVGKDWMLASFAAPLIGGVLLTGGSIAVYGTVAAACILRIVDVARAQFLLDPAWTYFITGGVVLFSVAISETGFRLRSAPTPKAERTTGGMATA